MAAKRKKPVPTTTGFGGSSVYFGAYWGPGSYGSMSTAMPPSQPPLSQDQFGDQGQSGGYQDAGGAGYADGAVGSDSSTGAN